MNPAPFTMFNNLSFEDRRMRGSLIVLSNRIQNFIKEGAG